MNAFNGILKRDTSGLPVWMNLQKAKCNLLDIKIGYLQNCNWKTKKRCFKSLL